jgi:hypothetical protein
MGATAESATAACGAAVKCVWRMLFSAICGNSFLPYAIGHRGQSTHMKRIPDRHPSLGSPSQDQRTCGVMGHPPFERFPWLAA